MSEEALLPPPNEPANLPAEPRIRGSTVVLVIFGLVLAMLAAGDVYLWQHPSDSADLSAVVLQQHAMGRRLADTEAKLGQVETSSAIEFAKLTARVDALDRQLAGQGPSPIQSGATVDHEQSEIAMLKQQIDSANGQISALVDRVGNAEVAMRRLTRIAMLQSANAALAMGRPIGDLPDAPAALGRYAHAAPPTEDQLKRDFVAAETTALAAKASDLGASPLIDRLWDRIKGLVTIRRGDNILVGDAVAVTLSRAEIDLDLGDLAGAVARIETLKGEPARAMAGWLSAAKGLLDARAALGALAGQT